MRSPEILSGTVFANRFVIEQLAGSGGMGTVYRARDLSSGDMVALKLLNAGHVGADEGERFYREAGLLSELRHPGIVSHIAHGQTSEGRHYLAMEWLDGVDLARRLQQGPLSVSQCFTLLRRVADALGSAHAHAVLHRDLKPSNLFLPDNDVGRIKILDFGIARRLGVSQALTQTGMVLGTPEYMAPEQARGSTDLTAAADMFSVGCVLYECLAGHPPFSAQHIAAVLVRILFEEPVPIARMRPDVPEALAGLLGKLLHKDPRQRVADACALQRELTRLEDVQDQGLSATILSPQSVTAAFAESEQSLFSVVLAIPSNEEIARQATMAGSDPHTMPPERHSLLDMLRTLGTSPDYLANGALVVTMPRLASAQDQAIMAARAALIIKDRWPSARVSLATAPGAFKGHSVAGVVVDRAAHILDQQGDSAELQQSGGVLLDTLTAKLLEGRFTLTPRTQGALLHSEGKESDFSRPLLGKPTPCVGRDMELGILESMLSGSIDESDARAVLVSAPPGAGKSRLRHEFMRRLELRSEPVTLLLGRGDLLDAGAAYRMLARAIRTLCSISGSEPPSEQRARLQRMVQKHLSPEDSPRVVPFVGELCGVPFASEDYPLLAEARQAPKTLPDKLRRACLSWLAAACDAAPVLIVLEDLHWGDALTISFIDDALTELRGKPLLVMAFARPEIHKTFPSLWQGHHVHEIHLKGLSKRACERLIQQVLGPRVSRSSVEWMVEQSAGNALFLEELIRASAEGQMERQPDTVIAMLQARIGHLALGSRRAVLAASVFGPVFWEAGVAEVLGLPAGGADLDRWMQEALATELIELHRGSLLVHQKEYGFRHALARDAAYALLTEPDQQCGHQRAAEFLEKHADEQLPSAVLAHHFKRAGLLEKALRYYVRAGDRAAQMVVYSEAQQHYQSADELLQLLPHTPELRRAQADLIVKQAQCSYMAGGATRMLERLALAQSILSEVELDSRGSTADLLQTLRIEYELGRWTLQLNEYLKATTHFEKAILLASQLAQAELMVLSQMTHGLSLFMQGQPGRALANLEASAPKIEQYLGRGIDAVRAYSYLAMVRAQTGRGRGAAALGAQVESWLTEGRSSQYAALFYHNFCASYILSWDPETALRLIGLCESKTHDVPSFTFSCTVLDLAGWVQNRLGNYASSLRYRQQALELRKAHKFEYWQDIFSACEADTLLKLGRWDEAVELAKTTSITALGAGSMWAYEWASRVWGSASARTGAPASEVDTILGRSLASAVACGNAVEALQTELAWAEVSLWRDDRPSARLYFTQALRRITDDMLPCAVERMQTIITEGLRRCD